MQRKQGTCSVLTVTIDIDACIILQYHITVSPHVHCGGEPKNIHYYNELQILMYKSGIKCALASNMLEFDTILITYQAFHG